MPIALSFLGSIALLLSCSCAPPADPQAKFTALDLAFVHTSGADGEYYLIETMGAGGAFIDFDGDGLLDIYLVDGFDLSPWTNRFAPTNLIAQDDGGYWVEKGDRPPLRQAGQIDSILVNFRQEGSAPVKRNQLWRNRGQAEFAQVADGAGAADPGYGMGCAVADYDGDGHPDLYITNYGRNALYHNNGDGTFTPVTDQTGVGDSRWGTSAAFFDYDNDGDLDLYIANYLDFTPDTNRLCGGITTTRSTAFGTHLRLPTDRRSYCSPRRYNGVPDVLYRNNGDNTFAEISEEAGVSSPFGKGLGVAPGDFDSDGDMDIYVANDGVRNFLYQNQGDGTFAETALAAGAAYNRDGKAEAGMGIALGDSDNDSHLDLFVTNFSRESNTLYHNKGDGTFADHSLAVGLSQPTLAPLGFGTFFFDGNNNGFLDLFVANGHVKDKIQQLEEDLSYAQPNQLFANSGDSTFTQISATSGAAFALARVSRGAAYGDVDNDGDQDILVTNANGPASLYRNQLPQGHNWVGLHLVGKSPNRDAVGARVRLKCGDRVQTRQVGSYGSYLSASDIRLHFGLGECEQIEWVNIRWPNGHHQEVRQLASNRFHRLGQTP